MHEKIPSFPREVAMKIVEEELGCPVENIFSYISEEPIAAASFGQVNMSFKDIHHFSIWLVPKIHEIQ